jgi:integral membrane protein
MKSLQLLRLVAILEGISFLLILFVTMPLKYIWQIPEPTYLVGMAHGVLFMVYCALVVLIGIAHKWKLITLFWALMASVIPFGTFIADARIFKPALVSKD